MVNLDEETIKRLRHLQRTNKERRVFIKVTVLLMLHKQYTPQEIADSLGIDDGTVYRYRQSYDALGLEAYLQDSFVAYSGQLSKAQEEQLSEELRTNLYINSREIAEHIEQAFGAGRKRININGALNAHEVTEVLFVEEQTINAQSCIRLWEQQRLRHPDKTIINICDNAPYYHSKVLRQWLEQNPWCKAIYLPPYSPNLNLIERLWKFLRKQVTSYFFYEHFAEFRQAVLDFSKISKNINERWSLS